MKKASVTNKTAFVVGNGPSLISLNFQDLKPYTWVGMNAAYRDWERTGIYPTHYACLDEIVGISHADSICKLVENGEIHGIEAFLLRDNLIHSKSYLESHPKVFSYEEVFSNIPERVRDLVTTGSHAALWLTILGYEQIVLLGIDANYVETVATAKAFGGNKLKIVKSGTNPNYYFNDYQKTGDTYMKPNPVPGVHTGAWKRAAQYIARTAPKVTLLNGSPISNVDCAGFIDIQRFLRAGSPITSPEFVFSAPQRQKHRQALLPISEASRFSLAKFVDRLSSSKYHQYACDKHDITELSKLGWTLKSTSNLRPQWGLISYLGNEFLETVLNETEESAIVAVYSDSSDEMRGVIEKLQAGYDTILNVYITPSLINITPAPCNFGKTPSSVIAFKRERFLQSELQTALEAADSQDYRGIYAIRRRLYHRLNDLRDAVKSVFR